MTDVIGFVLHGFWELFKNAWFIFLAIFVLFIVQKVGEARR